MREHELLHLRGRLHGLAELVGAQRAVDQAHRHGLALAVAEGQAVAARELRRLALAARELVDHFAFGDLQVADGDGEVELLGRKLELHAAEADLAHEGVAVRVAALRGIGHGQQEALVAAREVLQPRGPVGRKAQRRAREVDRCGVAGRHRAGFDQPLLVQQIDHARRGRGGRLGRIGRGRRRGLLPSLGQQREVEQALRVVVRRTQHLAAGQVLESGGDAAVQRHARGVERHAVAEPRQRRAVGAQQKDGLHHVARGLLDGERGQFGVVDRALGHHAVDRELELLADLAHRQLRRAGVAAALVGQQPVAGEDGGFPALDGNVHLKPPVRCGWCAADRRCVAARPGTHPRRAETARGSRTIGW